MRGGCGSSVCGHGGESGFRCRRKIAVRVETAEPSFLVGQVMRQSKGKANPGMVQELLKKKLG